MEADRLGHSGGGKRIAIILDTNMLLSIAEGINVLEKIEEYLETKPEYVVIKPVYDELVRLSKAGRPLLRKRARLALEVVKRNCRLVSYTYDREKSVDDLIVEYAQATGLPVATNDKVLRRTLRKRGIPQIYLRDNGTVESSVKEFILKQMNNTYL